MFQMYAINGTITLSCNENLDAEHEKSECVISFPSIQRSLMVFSPLILQPVLGFYFVFQKSRVGSSGHWRSETTGLWKWDASGKNGKEWTVFCFFKQVMEQFHNSVFIPGWDGRVLQMPHLQKIISSHYGEFHFFVYYCLNVWFKNKCPQKTNKLRMYLYSVELC